MKRALLATLIAVNLILLACVLYVNTPPAHAQAARGAPDYLAISGKIGNGEVLYLLDLRSRRMLAWTPNPTNGKLDYFRGGVDLKHDFGQEDK